MKVPFVDLHANYLSIRDEIDAAIASVIKDSAFIGGEYVARFEADFAQWMGMTHCVSCANGTDSLELILRAAGIGRSDEVIVPAVTWISTAEAVTAVGASPVFVDVNDDFLINLDILEAHITPRTRAIIPVHLYGNPVNMPELMRIANRHGLFVLEDCAQSHGAEVGGQLTGTFGHAASFSFYPGKNLGAFGDAGAVVTNDDQLAGSVRRLANHGQQGKHNHVEVGRNSRLDGIQAAILSAKLPYLHQWNNARIGAATAYGKLLSDYAAIRLPGTRPNTKHVFHLYVIRSANRDELMMHLTSEGIGTAIHYPVPLPFTPCYAHLGYRREDFPRSLRTTSILSLPMFAGINSEQIDHVAGAIKRFPGLLNPE